MPEEKNPFADLTPDQLSAVNTQMVDLWKSGKLPKESREDFGKTMQFLQGAIQEGAKKQREAGAKQRAGREPFVPSGGQLASSAGLGFAQSFGIPETQNPVSDLFKGMREATTAEMNYKTGKIERPGNLLKALFPGGPMAFETGKGIVEGLWGLGRHGDTEAAKGIPVAGPIVSGFGESFKSLDLKNPSNTDFMGATHGLGQVGGGLLQALLMTKGPKPETLAEKANKLDTRAAKLGSKVVKPAAEQVAEARSWTRSNYNVEGDRFWYGRALNDIVRPLDGLETVSKAVNKERFRIGQQMEQTAANYTNRGFYADATSAEAIIDKAIAEATSDPAAANSAQASALRRFKDTFFKYTNAQGQRVPKPLNSMTPTDLFRLKKMIGDFAYEQNGMGATRNVSKQVVHEINDILKKKVPGFKELAEKDSQLITASDRINQQLDSAVAGADVKIHDVAKVGMGGTGVSVKGMAYMPAPVASGLTKALITPSRTLRISMYRNMAKMLRNMENAPKPQAPNGMWPQVGPGPGPTAPPPQPAAPQAPMTAPQAPASPAAAVVTSQGPKPSSAPPKTNAIGVQPGDVNIPKPPVETAPQGGHAGNAVTSIEELHRSGQNYVVRKGGITYHGKQFAPESVKPGEAHVTVLPDGTIRTNAGSLTPEMEARVKAAQAKPGSVSETASPKTTELKPRSDSGKAALDAIRNDPEASRAYDSADVEGKRQMLKQKRDALNMQDLRGKARAEKMSEAESVLGGKAGVKALVEHADQSMPIDEHIDWMKKVGQYVEANSSKEDWQLFQETSKQLLPEQQRGWLGALAEDILEKQQAAQ